MSEAESQLSKMDRKIVKSARKQLPEIAENHCPEWKDGVCRKTGEPCGFATCPLIDRIAESAKS